MPLHRHVVLPTRLQWKTIRLTTATRRMAWPATPPQPPGLQGRGALDRDGRLVTDMHPVPDAAFMLLRDGIAVSLDARGVFWDHLVADPTRLIDPAAHHLTATVQAGKGQAQHRTFMVPATQTDRAFIPTRFKFDLSLRAALAAWQSRGRQDCTGRPRIAAALRASQ